MRRQSVPRRFSILELLFAIIAFGILANAALGTLWALKRAQRPQRQEALALLILDNTLTRLQGESPLSQERALAILREELAASASQDSAGLTPWIETPPGGAIRLGLHGPRGQSLAQVELPPCAAAASP